MRIRTSWTTTQEPRPRRARTAGFGTLAVLAALAWSSPAQQDTGQLSLVPVTSQTVLAPSQGDPGAPEPVIPEPPPVSSPEPAQAPVAAPDPAPVVASDPVPDPGPPALYPPELSGGPGLVPPGMTGPGGTTPLSGQGDAGLSASQPALVAPVVQPPASAPEPGLLPAPFALPGAPQPGVAPFAPYVQPVDPAKAPSACPENVAPGEILPPSIWSVCPNAQAPGWSYTSSSPFLPYHPQQQGAGGAPDALQIQIPWVAGFPSGDAESTLAMAGLNLGSVTEEDSTSSPGTVLRTDPPFGSAVEFGRAVNLIVAGR